MSESSRMPGNHFLQIPGPTPVPERVQQAMARAIIDHRGPTFSKLALKVLDDLKWVFRTSQPVMVHPSSGTGAWEGALCNTLSAGDKVLFVETGQFATLWCKMARQIGLEPVVVETDWRVGADGEMVEGALRADTAHEIKAVCIVHSETSTGCASLIPEIREAIDAVGHPALYMVDTVSSLGAMPYEHDAWKVDVTISGSQKGLMLPPGLSFTAVSEKALDASRTATLQRSYFKWDEMLAPNKQGFFPYTPATGLLYGLSEAVDMMREEGLENIFKRHDLLARATRAAVEAWGLEVLCRDPRCYSPIVTTVMTPEGHSADAYRRIVLETYNMSLGTGLNRLADKVFRIGHLGDTNELTVLGALSGVELGFKAAGIPHRSGGVDAAMEVIAAARGQAGPAEASKAA